MVFPVHEQRVWKILFKFDDYGDIEGYLRFLYESRSQMIENASIIKKIISSLPIRSEAIILDSKEILIKLPIHFRQKIFRRDHIIRPGQIIYRPHIPGISIVVYKTVVYEPVEIIGDIRREEQADRDSPPQDLLNLIQGIKDKGSFYVEILPFKPRRREEE